MTNFKFKTLTSAVILSAMVSSQAWADNTCGTSCTWEIVDGELKIHGTGDIADYNYGTAPWYSQKSSINSITIDEGITRVGKLNFYNIPANSISLPTTLKSIGYESFRDMSLQSIKLPEGLQTIEFGAFMGVVSVLEIPSSVTSIGDIHSSNPSLIILNANDSVRLGNFFRTFEWTQMTNVNVQCKGDIEICERMIQTGKNATESSGGTFNLSYYSGIDEDGNYVEYSDDGLAIYTDSTKAKPLGIYDFNGNQIASYKYDGAGNLTAAYKNGVAIYKRTSYTPTEAAAAVKKGNHNRVTLTFK